MQCNCVTGGLLVNWWPSQLCSNSAAPTSPWLVVTSHPDEHFSAMENYWIADYDVRDRFKGKVEWSRWEDGPARVQQDGHDPRDDQRHQPQPLQVQVQLWPLWTIWPSWIKSSLQTDRNFNHDCRDDKKRKAFQRGGPQKPKVQPAYEKVFLKIFTLHLLFSIQELIEKFHTESKARWQNLTRLLSSSIKSWESNCTSDV